MFKSIARLYRRLKHAWRVLRLPPVELVHRDDLPFEMIESIEDGLPDHLRGCRLKFAGDLAKDDPRHVHFHRITRLMTRARNLAFLYGLCGNCGKRYPHEYPPPTNEEFIASGWIPAGPVTHVDKILCPDCAAAANLPNREDCLP